MAKKAAFILKTPLKDRRKTFQFLKRLPDKENPGKYKYETISDERIDALNKGFTQKLVTLEESLKAAKALRDAFYKDDEIQNGLHNPVFHSDNVKVLEKYLSHHFLTRRRNIDERTTRHEYTRAMAAIGNTSILTGSVKDFQKAINDKFRGNAQRRLIIRLRSILRFLNRDLDAKSLILDHKDRPVVRNLSQDEIKLVRSHFTKREHQIVVDCLVYTGMRLGELFAIKERDLKGDALYVREQLSLKFEIRHTKNRKVRKTYVFEEGISALKEWFKLPSDVKAQLRKASWAEIVKKACRKALPKEKDKHLTAHDLRHCYVIWLLGLGVSLHVIAKAIGDSVAVCDEYYAGFLLTDDAIDTISRKVKEGN